MFRYQLGPNIISLSVEEKDLGPYPLPILWPGVAIF